MIKIFRNIRHRLLRENRFTRYLIYAIGEIILVVIGILIALQINNWNDNRKQQKVVQNYYDQLLSDLKSDISYSEHVRDRIMEHRKYFSKYVQGFEKPNLIPTDIEKLIENYPYNQIDIEYQSSTIETLINTGDIKLLDPELRDLLSRLNKQKLQSMTLKRNNNNDVADLLKDVIVKGGIVTVLRSNRLKNQKVLQDIVDADTRFADFYMALESYFMWRDNIEGGTIESLQENIALAKEISTAIERRQEK